MQVYRIFKGDINNLFSNTKVPEAVKAIDNTQQVGFSLKLAILDKYIFNSYSSVEGLFNFYESNKNLNKPRLIEENTIINVLQEATKNAQTKTDSKLPSTLSSLKSLDKPKVNVPGVNKINGAIGAGLTVNQVASKNKLDAMMGIKKGGPSQNSEDMNAAFSRFNNRNNGTVVGGNKLLSGLDRSTDTVTIDSLSKKIDSKKKLQNLESIKEENNNLNSNTLKDEKKEEMPKIQIIEKELIESKCKTENIEFVNKSISHRSNNSVDIDDEKILKSLVKKKSSKIMK